MGDGQKLTLNRINRIATGVQVIGDNSLLEGKIAYRVGLLGDYCATPLKRLEKQTQELIRKSNGDRASLIESKTGDPLKDGILEGKVGIMNNELSIAISDLGDEEIEIKVPELKMSDFIAKEEIKQVIKTKDKDGVDKNEVVVIKAGQALVPVRFFQMLGDLIKE